MYVCTCAVAHSWWPSAFQLTHSLPINTHYHYCQAAICSSGGLVSYFLVLETIVFVDMSSNSQALFFFVYFELQENVIQVEYVERSPPPCLSEVLDHRDWVSCVHCSAKLWVFVVCVCPFYSILCIRMCVQQVQVCQVLAEYCCRSSYFVLYYTSMQYCNLIG